MAIILLTSCSKPLSGSSEGLDLTYNPATAVEDIREMETSGILDSVQARLLRTYMVQKGLLATESDNAISSYRLLLNKALTANADGSDPNVQGKSGEAARAALVDLVILADSTSSDGHLVIVNVSVDNVSGQTILGIKGKITLYDAFREPIQSTSYRMLNPLGPGQRHQKVIKVVLDPTDGIFDYSGAVPMRVNWEPEEVILK